MKTMFDLMPIDPDSDMSIYTALAFSVVVPLAGFFLRFMWLRILDTDNKLCEQAIVINKIQLEMAVQTVDIKNTLKTVEKIENELSDFGKAHQQLLLITMKNEQRS